MEGGATPTAAGGGGAGPAPFLLKTYEMVDDSSTDDIVSWSTNRNSFVVWNPPDFARLLLPTYFKHNNFSSFIRQLNTYVHRDPSSDHSSNHHPEGSSSSYSVYHADLHHIGSSGFHKIDPERWEFANEDFVKDQKHLLKNIHRRKPIHSHSQPQSSTVDPERAAFEEEIDKLSSEKTALETKVLKVKQQQSAEKLQLEDLTRRVGGIEQRQTDLLFFLENTAQNPGFVEHLARKLESMDFLAYNKKRRLPQVDHSQPVPEDSIVDNNSSVRPEFGNIGHQDFSSKLRLDLSPAVSDVNLVSHSTQSSNEDGGSPHRRISEGCPKDALMRTGGLLFAPEALELSDTGTSFSLKMDSSLSRKAGVCENPILHSYQQSLTSNEDGDGHISCHLNLTLASSPLQLNKSQCSALPQLDLDIGKSPDSRSNAKYNVDDYRLPPKDINYCDGDATLSSLQEPMINNQRFATAQVRVNDVFWEQFLTERPGSSDNEEANSNYRSNHNDEPEDRRSGHVMSKTAKNVDHLTL